MSRLPVIVGLGGINAAGRSSGFHGYKRMVAESLSKDTMHSTWTDLSHRMALKTPDQELNVQHIEHATAGTLIRKISLFDTENVACNKKDSEHPEHLLKSTQPLGVSSGGQLPEGFDLAGTYTSRNHPRGLSLTVFGASDLLSSLGISWNTLSSLVSPDQVSVYASSALGQVDEYSLAGLAGNPLNGGRVSSKMLPLSMPDMPANFINSYVLNSLGTTSAAIGACASFLYNLKRGVEDIKNGAAQISIVGTAEAALTPQVISGFAAMGALGEDHQLRKLDGSEYTNNRRACRPFSTNAGFTIAESGQFVMLMSDELALKSGANILGSVPDVFINADANKKSISAPGVGNYITMMKAASLANSILKGNLHKTHVQAHGTGTPQNRVTESHILNEVAKTFGLNNWDVTSVKSYVGHSIGSAAGDQLACALGSFQYGVIPGIKTIDHIAEDVHNSHLNILMQDKEFDLAQHEMQASIINSKGFGGNNASALLLSPEQTKTMLKQKHGDATLTSYLNSNEKVALSSKQNDELAVQGEEKAVYHFGNHVISDEQLSLSTTEIKVAGAEKAIPMPKAAEFSAYL